MSVYYPQAALILRVFWEDFGNEDEILQREMILDPIIPRSVEVEINSVNEADTFRFELDYKFFPFDPRTIRSLGVTIHMEDMEAVFNNNGSQRKITPNDENTVLVGFADENMIRFDDDNRTVSIEGRDYTALLIDQKFFAPPPNLTQDLSTIIKTLIDSVRGAESIEIENRTGEALPIPSEIEADLNKLSAKKEYKIQCDSMGRYTIYTRKTSS